MPIRALGYVGLGVSNLDRWQQFATRILGLEVLARDPGGPLFCRMDDRRVWGHRRQPVPPPLSTIQPERISR